MRRAIRTILLAACVIAALSHATAPAQLLGVGDDEYAVYSAYLAAQRPTDGSRVRFAISTPTVAVDLRYLADSDPDLGVARGCSRLPAELLTRLRALSRENFDLSAHWFRGGDVGILTKQQFANRYGGPSRDVWAKFDQDYPNSHGLHHFSRVAFDTTRTWALFYVSYSHGGFDAGGELVVMRHRDGRWTEDCSIPLWDA